MGTLNISALFGIIILWNSDYLIAILIRIP